MEFLILLWKIFAFLFGIGILILLWRIFKMIFKKWIYSDKKLKNYVDILPRSTGIQFIGNKLYLYFTVINLSCIYNLKIEPIEVMAGCYELKKFRIEEPTNSTLIKRTSISIARMERDVNKDEIEYFLRMKNDIKVRMKVRILAFNWFFGNRIIEEKNLKEATVLVEDRGVTS